ncbi:hypothetical protein GQ55_6G276800 [Panicum hallii var. hallii]|uniref:Uncharacterized protein n=1 Tax=Panicum hallii var. hallii TaxID=1504633 RepID=A0A2T7DA90_9POAL|nr:hypothetical protein GQ55_6G276800 [Panicum hallii var. hallii]
MAESLLLGVVRGVVGKAADALVQSVTRMWGVDEDRGRLERHLVYVQSLLADAEAKSETNHAVRTWMKELKAAAYQADDILDDFQYEALRREVLSGRSLASKVLSNFTAKNKLVFRHKASRDLKNVLGKIDELVTEMRKFDLVVRVEAPTQALYRQTHSALHESKDIFGREDDKEVVVKLLLNQQDQQDVQVLPIIGMGGVGKTTLAKMVYNNHRIQKHFELKMWHCVSENFEAIPLVRSIIELAINSRCDLPDTIELLQRRLQEAIGRKRFLLILDDVWNEDQRKWEDDLKPLMCSRIGGSGSMIVVTSRSRQVASIMGTLPPHELVCLSEDDSWELFSKKAFSDGVQEQADLVTIGRRIVNKCKGLPLALKTMGGLMSSKHQVQEWEAIADCNISDTNRGKDEVLPILKLSYKHLSPEMKQCFAFCAVFPKDYEMEKDVLIQLWMANGYIHEEGNMDLAKKGELVFNELVQRSFLQDVNVKEFLYGYQYHKEIGCKMHDLMYDLAKDVTDECASVEELTQSKASVKDVHHMIVPSCELDDISTLPKGTSSLRTLLIQSRHKDIKDFKLTSLRAFCCINSSFIRSPLINGTHLRYLDLSGSDIARLPNSLCVLYNLHSLRLNECYHLRYLPERITNLRKLNHLYLLGCDSLERMPPNLSILHNLRTLTTFVVNTGDGLGIEELKDLQKIGNLLELYNLRKVKSGSNANLQEKHKLSELRLYWGRNEHYNPLNDEVSNNAEEVLESFVPHGKLKILEVHGYGGHVISRWMRNPQIFQCLRALRISNCPRCKDLPVVWLSSSLEHLYLSCMDSLTTLCKNIDVETEAYNTSLQIFPKLKMLELSRLPKLEKWVKNDAGEPDSSVMFPQLEELIIRNCNKLATLPVSPVLKRLSCHSYSAEVQISMSMPLGSWPSLVVLDIGLLADLVMPLENHQSLRSLKIVGDSSFVSIFNLSKLQQGLRDCLVFMEELNISNCNSIVCWQSEEFLALPQLKRLYIHVCHSLLEIPQLPASLVEVEICWCESLISLPSNLGNLAKLRWLRLHHCRGLEALPDVMDGLTSLEVLTILQCPGIGKLPQGLLQQLQAIKCLQIEGCPELQRRCRQGGEYFDLISCIPRKRIPAAEPKREKSLKRFLRHY